MGLPQGITPIIALKLTFDVSHQDQQSIQRQKQILDQVSEIQAGTKGLQKRYSQAVLTKDGIGGAILNLLTSRADSTVQVYDKQILQRGLITVIYQDIGAENVTNVSIPSIPADRQERLWKSFLARLRYTDMEIREGQDCTSS